MHRGRSGGNARKRKAKLTDATFRGLIGAAPEAAAATLVVEVDVEAAEAAPEEPFAALLLDEPAAEPGAQPTGAFSPQDYLFGYKACAQCHNEQAYYVPRAALLSGYTFRCRVCQVEVTVAR